jgi:hypothetical protein
MQIQPARGIPSCGGGDSWSRAVPAGVARVVRVDANPELGDDRGEAGQDQAGDDLIIAVSRLIRD